MDEELQEKIKKAKANAYYKRRRDAIKEGTWAEKKKHGNLEGMSEEEKRVHAYKLRNERRKQYTIEIEKGKASLFDARLKQYGDKASKIFRIALDEYLYTHPDIENIK